MSGAVKGMAQLRRWRLHLGAANNPRWAGCAHLLLFEKCAHRVGDASIGRITGILK